MTGTSRQKRRGCLRLSGLRARMALSYIVVTVSIMSVLLTIVGGIIFEVLHNTSALDSKALSRTEKMARLYALVAASQADGDTLSEQSTFQQGQPGSLDITAFVDESDREMLKEENEEPPRHRSSYSLSGQIAVTLVSTNGKILACSDMQQCTEGKTISGNPYEAMIREALQGRTVSRIVVTEEGREPRVALPVKRLGKVIGAVFISALPAVHGPFLHFLFFSWFEFAAVTLLIITPFGLLFGVISTRGLIRRIQRLAQAAERFAQGHYQERLQVQHHDELGDLEVGFNHMADQLVQSLEIQRRLTERNARLEERTHIARELHDSVKQHLFAVSMQLGAGLALLEESENPLRRYLLEADNLAYQARQELTALIKAMRPSALQHRPFLEALRQYVSSWSRQHSIPVKIQLPMNCTFSPEEEEALFRIAQEALANVARHSQATEVSMQLACESEGWSLTLTDNGRGFDAQRASQGVGLASMRERMNALGGMLTIESSEQQGTTITARRMVGERVRKDG